MHSKPRNIQEYKELFINGEAKHIKCVACADHFNEVNTKSEFGWRQTQLSGYCEHCFDGLFPPDEYEE